MKSIITTLALSCMLIGVNGCAALKQIEETRLAIETCTFTLKSIKPSIKIKGPKITLSGVKGASAKIVFDVDVDIENTTDMDLSMNRFDLNVSVDNNLIATGTTSKKIMIAAGEIETLPAKISVPSERATKKLAKKLQGNDVDYRVDGSFYFKIKNFDVPVSVTLKKG